MPIQAAAMGIPVIVSDATGCVDAVSDANGVVFPVKSKQRLEDSLLRYIEDENLRAKHGQAGPEWAANFNNKTIWQGIDAIYKR